jgi:glucokinase
MKKYVIGVDLGGTNTKVALIGKGRDIIKRIRFATKAYKTKDRLVNAIVDAAGAVIKAQGLKPLQIQGIGIGVPGLVDSKRGIVHCLTNISGWENVNLKKIIKGKTGIHTQVDNDVNLMALAESRFGAAKGAKNVFCVTLGTGVGGGIVIDGRIYRGATQSAGEIGHVQLDPSGPKCNCGRRGCLEAYIGNSYVIKRATERLKKDQASILKGRITPELITEAAKEGDRFAIQIWKEVAEYLSTGLIFVVNVLNPQVIVIGGGMAAAGKFLFEPLIRKVRKDAMSVPAQKVRIVKARLGNDAGIIGAAELVREGKDWI